MADLNSMQQEDPIQRMKQELLEEEDRQAAVTSRGRSQKVKVAKVVETCIFALVVLILSFVLISVLSAKENGKTPQILGYQLYKIETGSMEPTLRVGALILSQKPKDASDLKTDDIITFISSKGKTITHRIIDVQTEKDGSIQYQTKGDNPINSPDAEPVTPEMVEAVFILKIPLT